MNLKSRQNQKIFLDVNHQCSQWLLTTHNSDIKEAVGLHFRVFYSAQ